MAPTSPLVTTPSIQGVDYAYHRYQRFGEIQNHRYLWPAVVRELIRERFSGGSLLDAGCGSGALTDLLRRTFNTAASGCDLSESGIRLARANAPECRFEQLSMYDDLVKAFSGTFDVVVSVEVIEHLYDPQAFVERLRAVTSDEGLLILTTPYHGYLKNLAIAATNGCDSHYNPLSTGGHIKFWSKRTIRKLLEARGFLVDRVSAVGRTPFLWKSMIVVARPV